MKMMRTVRNLNQIQSKLGVVYEYEFTVYNTQAEFVGYCGSDRGPVTFKAHGILITRTATLNDQTDKEQLDMGVISVTCNLANQIAVEASQMSFETLGDVREFIQKEAAPWRDALQKEADRQFKKSIGKWKSSFVSKPRKRSFSPFNNAQGVNA